VAVVSIVGCRIGSNWPGLSIWSTSRRGSTGGGNELDNLAWACSRCNRHKGTNLSGVDPDSNRVVPLFHARRDVWEDHFELSAAQIRGKTAVGRATAWLLQMNADRRVELRAQLVLDGLW
jgi:hypothetical protein